MSIPYDGILGKDFFENRHARIDYGRKEITMGEVKIKFDENEQSVGQAEETWVMLKPRC